MNKKQINNNINDVFKNETPNFLFDIKEKCENTKQIEPVIYNQSNKKTTVLKRVAILIIVCTLFISGLLVGLLSNNINFYAKETSIILDVNPSVSIQLNNQNEVIECLANNKEGEEVLENITLDGVAFDTAIYAVISSMYTNGYLNNEKNSILVSVASYNDNNFVLNSISQQIDNVFKGNNQMKCSIIAQRFDFDKILEDKANQYKISMGKMYLIEKIIESNELYTQENLYELSQMSIHELDLIYQSIYKGNKEDEFVSGKPSGFIENEKAIDYVLKYLNLTKNDLSWCDTIVLYHHNESKERNMIYLVTIILKGDRERQRFIVDCSTGKIMPDDTVEEWKEKIPNDGFFGGTEK